MTPDTINTLLAKLENIKYETRKIPPNYDEIIETIDKAIDTITILATNHFTQQNNKQCHHH